MAPGSGPQPEGAPDGEAGGEVGGEAGGGAEADGESNTLGVWEALSEAAGGGAEADGESDTLDVWEALSEAAAEGSGEAPGGPGGAGGEGKGEGEAVAATTSDSRVRAAPGRGLSVKMSVTVRAPGAGPAIRRAPMAWHARPEADTFQSIPACQPVEPDSASSRPTTRTSHVRLAGGEDQVETTPLAPGRGRGVAR